MNIELMLYEDFRENETIKYGTAATSASANHAPLVIKKELNRLYNYVKLRFGETPLAWDARATYSIGDMVTHNGDIYECIHENANQEPPNAAWQLFNTDSVDMDLKSTNCI